MIMSRRACFYLMSLLAAMALLVGCKSSRKAVEGETVQEKSRKASAGKGVELEGRVATGP